MSSSADGNATDYENTKNLSPTMQAIRDKIPEATKNDVHDLCKKYGWRINPLSAVIQLDPTTKKLQLPPGQKKIALFIMHFMGSEYSDNFLGQTLRIPGGGRAHMHQLRTKSDELGSGIQCWNHIFYLWKALRSADKTCTTATFQEFFYQFLLSDSIPVLLPSNDHGELVSLPSNTKISADEEVQARKAFQAYRVAEFRALAQLLPEGVTVHITTMGKDTVNYVQTQLKACGEYRKFYDLNTLTLPHPCTFLPGLCDGYGGARRWSANVYRKLDEAIIQAAEIAGSKPPKGVKVFQEVHQVGTPLWKENRKIYEHEKKLRQFKSPATAVVREKGEDKQNGMTARQFAALIPENPLDAEVVEDKSELTPAKITRKQLNNCKEFKSKFIGTGDAARGNGVHQGGEGKHVGNTKRLRERGNPEDLAKLEGIRKRYKNLAKTHKCTHCTSAYKTSNALAEHIRIHTGEKPHKCTVCTKAFRTSSHLTEHIRTHTGERPYKCTYAHCNQAFKQRSNLTAHIRTHTGGKPYKCTYAHCNQAFRTSSHLTRHTRTHTGEKPYKCTYAHCNQAFRTSSGLTSHIRTHTGEKPYKCTYAHCNQAFKRRSNLTAHIRTHK